MQVLSEWWPNFPWMNLACCQTRERRIMNLLMLRPKKRPFCWTIPALDFSVGSAPGRALSTVSGDAIIKVGVLPFHILILSALWGGWDLLEIFSVSSRLICWFFLSARHLMLCFWKHTCVSRIELNISLHFYLRAEV